MKATTIIAVCVAVGAVIGILIATNDDEAGSNVTKSASDPRGAGRDPAAPAEEPEVPSEPAPAPEEGGGPPAQPPDASKPAGAGPDPAEVPPPGKPKKLSPMEIVNSSTVTLSNNDISALEVLLDVAGQVGVTIDMSEEIRQELAGRKISIALADSEAKNALDLILVLLGSDLSWGEKDGRIVIHR